MLFRFQWHIEVFGKIFAESPDFDICTTFTYN